MKKQLFKALFCCLLMLPFGRVLAQSTMESGQSTEGKDFWVTFLKADQDDNNAITLSLSISAREDSKVTISNPYTGYTSEEFEVKAGELKIVELYSGSTKAETQRANDGGKTCYAVWSEVVDTCALHVESTGKISLFASNYKKATFDATNVLPTASLMDSYIVQTYTPSDHKPVDVNKPASGSHFAIIAAEDDVIVDYCPSVNTKRIADAKSMYEYSQGAGMTPEEIALANFQPGDTLHTPVLKMGQVYYVWTGNGEGDEADLSGTKILAREGKKIAVFQGCPHTNIPYKQQQRDHIVSQAMPTPYWGNEFVLTTSSNRKRDVFRVMALNDGTEVYINGNLEHTFDFSKEPKQFWEFELGDLNMSNARTDVNCYAGPYCVLKTSCPSAVHLFLASKEYDKVTNGDPAMLWVNPIEQQIDQVTFATYVSKNGTTNHYVNIVTENKDSMYLDGSKIAADFQEIAGTRFYYAQKSLGTAAATHTLQNRDGAFIAHVYGFTNNESYGYSAGGATRILTNIEIEGETYVPGMSLCGDSVINFSCKLDTHVDKLVWNFGDGSPMVEGTQDEASEVEHYYPNVGEYQAYVLIYRSDNQGCGVTKGMDSIALNVRIERAVFDIKSVEVPCVPEGQPRRCYVSFTNEGKVDLQGDNVTIEFDEAAKEDEFDANTLSISNEQLVFDIPAKADVETVYGLKIAIETKCGAKADTLLFKLPFDNNVIDQRYENILGLLTAPFHGKQVGDFQWYSSNGTPIEGQVSAVLNFMDISDNQIPTDSFYVCFTINKGQADELMTCACPKAFKLNTDDYAFEAESPEIIATYSADANGKVFVNADYKGASDIECYAQWITVSGQVYNGLRFDIPDGGCTIDAPKENGLYLLRVVTDKKSRSFKFIINN